MSPCALLARLGDLFTRIRFILAAPLPLPIEFDGCAVVDGKLGGGDRERGDLDEGDDDDEWLLELELQNMFTCVLLLLLFALALALLGDTLDDWVLGRLFKLGIL
jgi:hypothetical protein